MVSMDDDLTGLRINDIFQAYASEHPVADPLNDLTPLDERSHIDAIYGFAVILSNRAILRYIHQTPGQITRVGGLERSIRQSLARPVGRNKILQNRQAFPEISGDRGFNNFP